MAKDDNVKFRKSVDWKTNNKPITPEHEKHSSDKKRSILEQRNRAKLELINKYNMSESEAEETLRNIEKKAKEKKAKKMTYEQERIVKQNQPNFNKKSISPEQQRRQYKEEPKTQPKEEKPKVEEKPKEEPKTQPKEEKTKVEEKPKETQEKGEDDSNKDDLDSLGDIFEKPKEDKKEKQENLKKEEKPKPEQVKEENIAKSSKKDEIIPEHAKEEIIPEHAKADKKIEDKSHKNVDELISNMIPDSERELCIEVDHVSLSFEVATEKIDNIKELFVRTLKRKKGNKTKFQALNDISFKIYKGEKIGIIGYNGAGKSTLLNVITGIYPPETGEVKTYGRISPLLALGAGFDYNYSGRENIYLNGAIMGYSKKFLESKFDEIVEFSELEEFIDFPVKNYSSGMMAKLGFSVATIVEPDILIIDEVLGVGDVNFRKKSQDKIRSLMDSGTTVLLVSHSIPEIRKLCDKAIWIDKGKVREIGEVNDVCNHYLKDAEKATKEQLKDIRFR